MMMVSRAPHAALGRRRVLRVRTERHQVPRPEVHDAADNLVAYSVTEAVIHAPVSAIDLTE